MLVTHSWQTVAQVWAAALAVMAVIFWFFTEDDPALVERRRAGVMAKSFWLELEPLKNIHIWRFGLYYFAVFGAFLALALWLPAYLINVYGLDIKTAGVIAAFFSVPASIFRAYGGHLSESYGARRVLYWTLLVSAAATFILSYPPTDFVVHGAKGTTSFHLEMGLFGFAVTLSVLGFFIALGKAAVYKHIPAHYPDHLGSVGGLVGMMGGLGGFLLTILFGVLFDLTGLWTSCFMALFVLVAVALLWTHISIRHMERGTAGDVLAKLPPFPEMLGLPKPVVAPQIGHTLKDWRPDDPVFWESTGRLIARRNLWISIPALLLSFAVWQVWSVVVAKLPLVGFNFTTDQLFWLAALPGLSGATLAHLLFFHGADLRRPTLDRDLDLVAPDPGSRHRLRGAESGHPVLIVLLMLALLCGFGGGNFASSMANICFFFPKAEKGNALGSTPGLAISVSAWCSSSCRWSSLPAFSAGSAAIPSWSRDRPARRRYGCRTPASSGSPSSYYRRSPPGSA